MATRYYQVGGYQPHIILSGTDRYDVKKLAQALEHWLVQRINKIELILGITRVGASSLLLTEEEAEALVKSGRGFQFSSSGRPADAFESLSPIEFANCDGLFKKLSGLQPKGRAKRTDDSKENKAYVGPGATGLDEPARGAYEHSRLLYRILEDLNNTFDPRRYGVNDVSWKNGLQFAAFAVNMAFDDRPRQQQLETPKPLDVGFCMAVSTYGTPRADKSKARHFKVPSNKMMGIPRRGKIKDFESGQTEMPESTDILGEKLREIFAACRERTSAPLVLLVHDEERTRSVLSKFGVDTSRWESGIKGLVKQSPGYSENSDRSRPSESYKYQGRARSPPRGGPSRSSYGREMSPPRRRPYDERTLMLSYDEDVKGSYGDRYNSRDNRARGYDRYGSRGSGSYDSGYGGRGGGRGSGDYSRDRYGHRGSVKDEKKPDLGRPQNSYAPVYVVDVLKMYRTLTQEARTDNDPLNDNILLLANRFTIETGGADWRCAGEEAIFLFDIWEMMAQRAAIDEERKLFLNSRGEDEEDEEEDEEEEDVGDNSDEDPNAAVTAAATGSEPTKDYYESDDNDPSDSDSD